MKKDNWSHAVGCVVMREDKVLLVRHTYGNANGKLLIPGGYVQEEETPEKAAIRELFEETKVHAEVKSLVAMRFSPGSWYAVFLMEYSNGEPVSDLNENSEAFFMNIEDAINNTDLTNLTKILLEAVITEGVKPLAYFEDYTKHKGENHSLYTIK